MPSAPAGSSEADKGHDIHRSGGVISHNPAITPPRYAEDTIEISIFDLSDLCVSAVKRTNIR